MSATLIDPVVGERVLHPGAQVSIAGARAEHWTMREGGVWETTRQGVTYAVSGGVIEALARSGMITVTSAGTPPPEPEPEKPEAIEVEGDPDNDTPFAISDSVLESIRAAGESATAEATEELQHYKRMVRARLHSVLDTLLDDLL